MYYHGIAAIVGGALIFAGALVFARLEVQPEMNHLYSLDSPAAEESFKKLFFGKAIFPF